MKTSFRLSFLVLAAASLFNPVKLPAAKAAPAVIAAAQHEHSEFEATLNAPYHGDGTVRGQPDARSFTLSFDYPGLQQGLGARWQLELVAPGGRTVQRWQGSVQLAGRPRDVTVRWQGRLNGRRPAPGIYRVRLHAVADETVEQSWEIAVGQLPAPLMPAFAPLPTAHPGMGAAPAPASLPYTVYYGNLHSQTSHSDGGAPLDNCKGAQEPQTAPYGPDAAYPYARDRGLDLLMVSEHNHMYDGSDGTDSGADPAVAKALYQSGLQAARGFNAAHPGFLALYGMEWGVISKGGHLNIFNSDELLGWEKNGRGDLLADTATARSDYGALYTLMKERGWIGQFNHPANGGQFVVNGVALGYTPDGDAAMALCEVLNTSAFSTNDKEQETRRSNFEQACNKALEAGYHVAFSSNQDNHCANWGASYTNRTAVLVPNGVPLTRDSFVEALRARRVFATMDKHAQLVFTANGRLMGERFDNSGPLVLKAHYASDGGKRVASVAVMEGVPGRNGTVTQVAAQAEVSIVPAPGQHFYYVKLTQDDGNVLWSAPVWVNQVAPAIKP
ncbi:CehA/McbA family metallohydrolase [Herbaspirillum sp. SJZ107]|uniref:CehA/McbA family metallohydrolase n=1 Tax=Herbaspirillum sp. SJZ107 TaxID=2572881 RepID=UPI00116F28BE|nr:CehA/McbA family metallohydrolase [Herbaspirillum sp. SJZ107]TQK05069.1 hypothetical protein FBX97_4034 [Herbaspirillum sp. SJZ107]